jgi:hypothetical protein
MLREASASGPQTRLTPFQRWVAAGRLSEGSDHAPGQSVASSRGVVVGGACPFRVATAKPGDDERSFGDVPRVAADVPSEPRGIVSFANVPKSVPKPNENGPRSDLRGPFLLVAGTGFEPATSGL